MGSREARSASVADGAEAGFAAFPLALGFGDDGPAGADEVPPHVDRFRERLSPRSKTRVSRAQQEAQVVLAASEIGEFVGCETLAGNLRFAAERNESIFENGLQGEGEGRRHRAGDVQTEQGRMDAGRRSEVAIGSGQQRSGWRPSCQRGQYRMMGEIPVRSARLSGGRAIQSCVLHAGVDRRPANLPWTMPAGGHQIDFPGRMTCSFPRLSRWSTSPSINQVKVCSPMWGGVPRASLVRQEIDRAGVVEEAPGADHALLTAGQHAPDQQTVAEIGVARRDA